MIRIELDRKTEIEGYEHVIKHNIDYDTLIERYPLKKDKIDGIVDIVLHTIVNENDYIVIVSNSYPKELEKALLGWKNMLWYIRQETDLKNHVTSCQEW